VEVAKPLQQPEDFVFPSERLQGSKPLDLASVLKKKIQPAFRWIGITGVGWHTFRHSVGTMLAEMGEHQVTIRDYFAAQQPSCHEQVPTGDVEDQTFGTGQIGRRNFADETRFIENGFVARVRAVGVAYWSAFTSITACL
jgi:hypothetical protein